MQALFPVKSPRLKRAKENPFVKTKELAEGMTTKLLNKGQIKVTAKALYDVFQSVSDGMSFAEALKNVPDTNLEMAKSQTEKKAVRRNILREAKENMEEQWKNTSLIR